jgi:uncharacterized protein (TIGR03435 family)
MIRSVPALVLAFVTALAAQPLKFQSVTIKPHADPQKTLSLPTLDVSGRMRANIYFRIWIKTAYDIPISDYDWGLIENVPDWLGKEYYDVEAILPPTALTPGISIQEVHRRLREMQQTMLADRLQLRAHMEKREKDTYVVRVAEGGVKLPIAIQKKECPAPRQVDPEDPNVVCHTITGGRGRGMHARAATIKDVSDYVQGWSDKPIVDKTGLTDLYRIDTSAWLPIELTGKAIRPGYTQDGLDYSQLPSLFAVFERMGLKLVAEKSTVDVLVIDHIERPKLD